MIRFDYSFGLSENLREGGVEDAAWSALQDRCVPAIAALNTLHEAGESFLSSPEDDTLMVQATANVLRASYENALVIGIGGSALGAKCVHDALIRELSGRWRDGSDRDGADLYFCDNVDPVELDDLLTCLPLDDTAFAVITKSGRTIESMSNFLKFRELLLANDGAQYTHQVVAVTDPHQGALRALAQSDGLQNLFIPPGVGGRYSVFTPAGTLPLALAGVDVEAFLAGAAAARDAALRTNPLENPAACFAMLQCGLYEAGVHDVAFMPYSTSLAGVADWFVQLWSESLGKSGPNGPIGPTPIRAVGATDQHSQLQLFMQGPANKNVVFVEIEDDGAGVRVPTVPDACAELAHLGGRDVHEIRTAEMVGVRGALAQAGRPSSTLTLPSATPESLGALLMTLACATAMAGTLFGVDPFNQPGVEAAKTIAHGILGRRGTENPRVTPKTARTAKV